MAASAPVSLRVRVFTPDGAPVYCVFAFEVDPARRAVKTQSAAGSAEQFRALSLDAPGSELRSWFEELRYYGREDARLSQDLDRHLKRVLADESFRQALVETVVDRNVSRVEYALLAPLEHILGQKTLAKEFAFGDVGGPAPVTQEKPIPMQFLMAPLNGIPLLRLSIPQTVIARLADLKDARTKAFLASLPEEERNQSQFQVVVKGLREAPDVGSEAVRATVELPGGIAGEIVEENRYIRVRLPAPDPSVAKRMRAESATTVPIARFDVPSWAIFAAAAFLLLLFGTLLVTLL